MDVLHRILNAIDHNRYLVLGMLLPLLMIGMVIGCEPKMASVVNPGESVTIDVFKLEEAQLDVDIGKRIAQYEANGVILQAEIDGINAKRDLTLEGFAKKYEMQRKIIELGGGVATALLSGNPIDAAATAASVITLLLVGGGVGAIADNKRKDAVIKKKPV